jgi:hypothetical protein
MSAFRPCAESAYHTATRVAVMALCCLLLVSCGLRESKIRAEQGVKEFHSLLNSEQYDVIYDRSGNQLKKSWTRADFIAFLRDIHSRLGKTGKATTLGYQVNASTGQGTEVALAMRTEFERGLAEEQFVFGVEGNRIVLLGYRADIKRSNGPTTV